MVVSRRLIAATLVYLFAATASAQVGIRPGDERPAPVEPQPLDSAPIELPAPPPPPEDRPLEAGARIFVRAFRVQGSTVFSDEELEALTESYRGRAISARELVAARSAVTRHYVEHGYITSGAFVPDQPMIDGVVVIQVIEGALEGVVIEGAHWFRPEYFAARLERAGRAPVDTARVEAQLKRFQRDARIHSVEARIEPGSRRGFSVLRLAVEEASPLDVTARLSNEHSPRIGSTTGALGVGFSNALGFGDDLDTWTQFTEGLRDVSVRYGAPVTSLDTWLGARFRYSESEVVEHPFDDFDIEGSSTTFGVELEQPLFRSVEYDLTLALVGERRESETKLEGRTFCFLPNSTDCDPVVTVLRVRADWTWRGRSDALAARSTLSFGIDALGATGSSNDPDARYVAWLAQLQWVHRFPTKLLASLLAVRFDTQLTDDRVLAIEQFSVGGVRTVRGYRENQFVRDMGLVGSVELRIPIWRGSRGRTHLEIFPFADLGRSWNHDAYDEGDILSSLGLGVRYRPLDWLIAEIQWGGRLNHVPNPHDDPQDYGFEFRLEAVVF